jgi:7,8-dihydropterin-6-yl-methyl-4-(beta-D-ribofuranosyl)aminobenzene 5'-phosphate synthase
MAKHVKLNFSACSTKIMAKGLNLRVIVENSASSADTQVWAQHGLCFFLELYLGPKCMKILMDTGTSPEVTLHNADALNIDLRDLGKIFISHGHYDHTGGLIGILKRLNRRVPILAHPDIFSPKLKAQPSMKFIGPPFTSKEAEDAGAIMLFSSSPIVLAQGVMTTGQIERKEPFETVEGFWTIKEGSCFPDAIPDDQALIVNIDGKGLAVISGCAHAGIINTIKHAQKVTGIEDLYAVIGGFHLLRANEGRIASTIEALLELDPAIIRPGHCTGTRAVCRLMSALGERCQPLASGDSIQL